VSTIVDAWTLGNGAVSYTNSDWTIAAGVPDVCAESVGVASGRAEIANMAAALMAVYLMSSPITEADG
jgi:hypothetical protein